jgi:Putative Actinobacterial Holin-X, holin superfamily III
MPTPTADRTNGGTGGAARQVAEHASALAKLEIELAGLELKKKAASLGIGVGLAVTAGVLAFFMVGFLFATLAAGLATFLPTWLALLIVTLFLGLLVVTLGLIGRGRIRKGSPPVPEQAIREAKLTGEAIRQ